MQTFSLYNIIDSYIVIRIQVIVDQLQSFTMATTISKIELDKNLND